MDSQDTSVENAVIEFPLDKIFDVWMPIFSIIQETGPYSAGSPQYDTLLDHIHELALQALQILEASAW